MSPGFNVITLSFHPSSKDNTVEYTPEGGETTVETVTSVDLAYPVEDFTIYGYEDSAAEAYAAQKADEDDEETVNETGVTGKVIDSEIGGAFKSIKVDGEEVLYCKIKWYETYKYDLVIVHVGLCCHGWYT